MTKTFRNRIYTHILDGPRLGGHGMWEYCKTIFYPGTFPNGSGIKQLAVGIDQKGSQKRA